MDDMELGRKIATEALPGRDMVDYSRLGAAARAALTGPEVMREEVQDWCKKEWGFAQPATELILAALRHFARAKCGKVPSVEEIHEMMNDCPPSGVTDWKQRQHCARIAHAMMLRLGGRAEMMISDMDRQALTKAMLQNAFAANNHIVITTIEHCVEVAHRLATTPRTVDDPDKEAKRLAWEFHKAAFTTFDATSPDELWATFKDHQLVGWRAVAKGKADE